MSQPAHTPPRTPATEPNSSSSTLVNHLAAFTSTPVSSSAAATIASSTPTSSSSAMSALDTPAESVHTPFSPSFDPNVSTPFAQTPLALRPGGSPMPGARMGAGAGAGGTAVGDVSSRGGVCAGPTDPLWSQRLSASFSTIADQIAAASRALAIAEAPSGSSVEVAALAERLDAVERAQDVMGAQLRAVQELLANVKVNVGGPHLPRGAEEVEEVRKDGEGGDFKSGVEIAVEELQRQVGGVVETIRLEYVFFRHVWCPSLRALWVNTRR